MELKVTAIVQARVGSTRLKSKIFETIGDYTVLDLLLERLKISKKINEIIIATTKEKEDKAIVNYCKRNGYKFFTGSTNNVLRRFYDCAKSNNLEIIARVTADDPFKDPFVIDEAITIFEEGNFDYVSNTILPTYPEGIDIEIFSFSSLEQANKNAKKESDKLHVTPYIINNPEKFKCCNFKFEKDMSAYRFTLDYLHDLAYLNEIFSKMHNINFTFLEAINIAEKHEIIPSRNVERNEGYKKDLENDN
tara:strand:+ start:1901 stop:2647 length:747 start_codon:yes stop_codon:yes gene_type:complete